jgi:hypothetical protein
VELHTFTPSNGDPEFPFSHPYGLRNKAVPSGDIRPARAPETPEKQAYSDHLGLAAPHEDPAPPAPSWLDLEIRADGQVDSAEVSPDYVIEAAEENRQLRAAHAGIALGPLEELHQARLTLARARFDAWRAWGAPVAPFEKAEGLRVADLFDGQGVRLMIAPGSEARRRQELDEATRKADEDRKRAADRELARLNKPSEQELGRMAPPQIVIRVAHGAVAPDICQGYKPFATTNKAKFFRFPEVPGVDEQWPEGVGLAVLRGKDTVPELTVAQMSWHGMPVTSTPEAEYNTRIREHVAPITDPRPPWSTDGRGKAREIIRGWRRFFTVVACWQKYHACQMIVCGCLTSPEVGARLVKEEIPEVSEAEIAALMLAATKAPRIKWGSMIPTTSEKIADGWRSLVAPVVAFFSSRDEATSEEIASAVGVKPDAPELYAAARAANLEKVRETRNGTRERFWRRVAP